MTKKLKKMNIPITFEQVSLEEDDRFQKVKIWVAHTGENLNGSSFSKEVLMKMAKTLPYIPLLGYIEIDEDGQADYSDHRQIITVSKDGIDIRYAGHAYGFVPKEPNAKMEIRSGKEWLTCEAFLWTKFSDSMEIFHKANGKKTHSMEIQDIEGDVGDDGNFVYTSGRFSGLCTLGDKVNPGMAGSTIEFFSAVQNELKMMIEEFSKKGESEFLADNKKDKKEKKTSDTSEKEVKDEKDSKESEGKEESKDAKTTEDNKDADKKDSKKSKKDEDEENFEKAKKGDQNNDDEPAKEIEEAQPTELAAQSIEITVEDEPEPEVEPEVEEAIENDADAEEETGSDDNEEDNEDSESAEFEKSEATFAMSHDELRRELNRSIRAQDEGYAFVLDVYDDYAICGVESYEDDTYKMEYRKVAYTKAENTVVLGDFERVHSIFVNDSELGRIEKDRALIKELSDKISELEEFKDAIEFSEKESALNAYKKDLPIEEYNRLKDGMANFTLEDIEKEVALVFFKQHRQNDAENFGVMAFSASDRVEDKNASHPYPSLAGYFA